MNEDKTTGKDMGVITGGSSHRSKRLWVKIVILLAVLVLAGLVAGWFIYRNANYLNIDGLDSKNDYIASAQQLADQKMPDKPLDRAIWYGEIGAYLQAADQYEYAEHYYITAQKVVDDNDVDQKEARFYLQLADVYKALKNDKKADEYKKKEDEFMKANYSQAEIDQMNQAGTDEPRTK